MERDAFTGGVEPGGLWSKNDLRILICYILASVNGPLSREDIGQVLQGRALANYFESGEALAALEDLGHIVQEGGGYTCTPTGREIANRLDSGLPLAVRDKALESALLLSAQARARRENRVEIQQREKGCLVTCHIAGGEGMELMGVSLYVPDRAQAGIVEKRFYENPDRIYRLLLAGLTGEKEFAKEFWEEWEDRT